MLDMNVALRFDTTKIIDGKDNTSLQACQRAKFDVGFMGVTQLLLANNGSSIRHAVRTAMLLFSALRYAAIQLNRKQTCN
jgi:hypothetical protein